jgi:hypothetical protein
MTKEYTKEQLQKLYKNLPEELQKTLFSVETADSTWDISERYNIDKICTFAKIIGDVLFGILHPNELQEVLEKELNLETETAQKVVREINQFIFYPVRPFLEKLYESEIVFLKKKTEDIAKKKSSDQTDTYREPIT